MRALLRGTGLDVSFALYTGDSDTATRNLREEPAETERLSRAAIRRQPPDILLTNYKQLEFLLVRAEDRPLFTPALHYLVLDELHSYRGALATEIACLIRRLKAHAEVGPGTLVGIGTSATVASGIGGAEALAGFATVLFGEQFRAGHVIGESLAPRPLAQTTWLPAAPAPEEADILSVDPENEGVYDVALCLNPECRALVPRGGAQCPTCHAAARPAALCRTCGQDFVKLRFEREQDDLPGRHRGFLQRQAHSLRHPSRPRAP